MRIHQESQKKSCVKKALAPTPNPLESRPFAVQATHEETERSHSPKGYESAMPSFAILNPEGGRAMPVQPKLTLGAPGDKYEQEADRVAAKVVSQINAPQTQSSAQQGETLQRQELPDDKEELQMQSMVQRQPGEGERTATPDLESSIKQAKGSGQSLSQSIRQPMEQAFGADFSGVKIHTDAQSDQLNRSISALAFTTGRDIFFRQGAYDPGSRGGQELLAHELTHTIQQGGTPIKRHIQLSRADSPANQFSTSLEQDAEINNIQNVVDDDLPRANLTAQLLQKFSSTLGLTPGTVQARIDDEAKHRTERQNTIGLMEGETIYLHPQHYQPETRQGREVLAHEMTHLAQRQLGREEFGEASSFAAEVEANVQASALADGHSVGSIRSALPDTAIAAYTSADELVQALRGQFTATTDPTKLANPFGVLSTPTTGTFLDTYDYDTLAPEHLQDFFNKMNMVTTTMQLPAQSELETTNLSTTGGKTGDIPHVVNSIWLGGPLKDNTFKNNMVAAKGNHPDWTFNLWSNLPRQVLQAAEQNQLNGNLNDVRELIQWARSNQINLISVDEIFAGNNPMELEEFYKAEENKKTGVGYAGASDILRAEILKRFGGVYCDGDNVIKGALGKLLQDAEAQGGFQAAGFPGRTGVNNSALIASKQHKLVGNLIKEIQDSYTNQIERNKLVDPREARQDRFEVMRRTGPEMLKKVLKNRSQKSLDDFRIDVQGIEAESASSWYQDAARNQNAQLPGMGSYDAFKKQIPATESLTDALINQASASASNAVTIPAPMQMANPEEQQQMESAAQRALTGLLFNMKNLKGNLDLKIAERHVAKSPRPDMVFEAVLRSFATPELRSEASQVTSLSLPQQVNLPVALLDFLFVSGPFSNLKANTQAIQEAAFSGNARFMQYCIDKGLLNNGDPTNPSLDFDAHNDFRIETGHDKDKNVYRGGIKNILFFAIEGGNQETVIQLLSQPGIETWLANQDGGSGTTELSPVGHALYKKQMQIALWLLEAGARLDTKDSPLKIALDRVDNSATGFNVVRSLLATYKGDTAQAISKNEGIFDKFISDRNSAAVRYLVAQGADQKSKQSAMEKFIKYTDVGDAVAVVTFANDCNLLNELRQEALDQEKLFIVTAIENLTRAVAINPGDTDTAVEEELVRFQDAKKARQEQEAEQMFGSQVDQIKEDYKNPPKLWKMEEWPTFFLKAIAYANAHLGRNPRTASKERLRGWKDTITQMDCSLDRQLESLKQLAMTRLNKVKLESEIKAFARTTFKKNSNP